MRGFHLSRMFWTRWPWCSFHLWNPVMLQSPPLNLVPELSAALWLSCIVAVSFDLFYPQRDLHRSRDETFYSFVFTTTPSLGWSHGRHSSFRYSKSPWFHQWIHSLSVQRMTPPFHNREPSWVSRAEKLITQGSNWWWAFSFTFNTSRNLIVHHQITPSTQTSSVPSAPLTGVQSLEFLPKPPTNEGSQARYLLISYLVVFFSIFFHIPELGIFLPTLFLCAIFPYENVNSLKARIVFIFVSPVFSIVSGT